jgi:hypothetical protein
MFVRPTIPTDGADGFAMLQCDRPEGEGAKHGERQPDQSANELIHGFLLLKCWVENVLFWARDRILTRGGDDAILF